jgi:hypothetical protein
MAGLDEAGDFTFHALAVPGLADPVLPIRAWDLPNLVPIIAIMARTVTKELHWRSSRVTNFHSTI